MAIMLSHELHKKRTIRAGANSRVLFMPSCCPYPLRPATQDEQNTAG
jgi:hypothetical protein